METHRTRVRYEMREGSRNEAAKLCQMPLRGLSLMPTVKPQVSLQTAGCLHSMRGRVFLYWGLPRHVVC